MKEYLLVAVSATTIRKETIEAGERQAEIEEDMKRTVKERNFKNEKESWKRKKCQIVSMDQWTERMRH